MLRVIPLGKYVWQLLDPVAWQLASLVQLHVDPSEEALCKSGMVLAVVCTIRSSSTCCANLSLNSEPASVYTSLGKPMRAAHVMAALVASSELTSYIGNISARLLKTYLNQNKLHRIQEALMWCFLFGLTMSI